MAKVITRFAPSPTGFLHIGGARTALFNYLFARHHDGKYFLRIEDTDRARSTLKAMETINDGLDWLGLAGDGETVLQSSRSERHIEVANNLLETNRAYRCYLSPDELDALRSDAHKTGKKILSPWRDTPPANQPDKPFTVRLKMPESGTTTIDDVVQGKVSINHDTLDDLVMLRGDGTPTYMLAVVVDDYDMGISHVIRGDDHLNNAFRQQKIIEAMEWQPPHYAHIPLIHGADGARLSKRHGAVSVTEYRDGGFLPEALCNYLLRLGWGHGDDEIISRKQAIKWFGLDAIGKSPARFDMEKLNAVSRHYIKDLPDLEKTNLILSEHKETDFPEHIIKRLAILAPALAERATTTHDLIEGGSFALSDTPPPISDNEMIDAQSKEKLLEFASALPCDDFADADSFKNWFKDWLEANALKMKDIAPALRIALTGVKQSPDIGLIGYALGVKQIKIRVEAACK